MQLIMVFRKFALVLLLVTLYVPPISFAAENPSPSNRLSGTPQIIDVDTFRINGVKIRLWGIDGPGRNDRNQPDSVKIYEDEATDFLKSIAGGGLDCDPNGKKSYDRVVAQCFLTGSGKDLAAVITRAGYGVDDPKFSKGLYRDFTLAAKQEKIGIWRTVEQSWK